jgi:lipid-A-disaccharide synthase
MKRLALVAGEASGDLLASQILDALGQAHPGLQASGVGGPKLMQAGLHAWYPSEALAVRGYAEVVAALPRLLRMRSALFKQVLDFQPQLFLGVDAPDFNLTLERKLRVSGIKVAHFVSPSIWAWRPERITKIAQSVDHMLLVFPFEKKLYDQARIASTYVGHPLADVIPMHPQRTKALEALGLPHACEVVALLPGSRADEVKAMGRTFVETALWLHSMRDDLVFVMPAAGDDRYAELTRLLAQFRFPQRFQLKLVRGQAYDALAACQTALVASGTATLEAALFKRPMVVTYKMHPWSYRWMKRKALQPYVGLPNILCGSMVVPEILQDRATPQALGAALLSQLRSLDAGDEITQRFSEMHHTLRMGCARRSAEVLGTLL